MKLLPIVVTEFLMIIIITLFMFYAYVIVYFIIELFFLFFTHETYSNAAPEYFPILLQNKAFERGLSPRRL